MSGRITLQPISFVEACAFVAKHHRHHRPPQGWKFGVAANDGERVVGVAMVGRPVARHADDGWTLEVTRCCTDGAANAASMLYGACWRAARALGYRRLITYTLAEERGVSLFAAGWRVVGQTPGGSWSSPSRPRVDTHPLGQKTIWEAQQMGRTHECTRHDPGDSAEHHRTDVPADRATPERPNDDRGPRPS